MPVLARSFFNLAVIKVPLPSLIAAFGELPRPMNAKATPLVFPSQPYSTSPADPPLLLRSPPCAPELTAFMPQVSSGDYFVVENACRRIGYVESWGAPVRDPGFWASRHDAMTLVR